MPVAGTGSAAAVTAALTVALTSGTVTGIAVIALHGTRWSYNAIWSDAAFRTEAATRFADTWLPADYAYRGLPAYYPPALPWIQGRAADLAGVEAWAVIKPVMLVFAVLVPAAAYVVWRRVVPDVTAAAVVAFTSLTTADLIKPDEWLVLAVAVPWWLELVRDVRRPGTPRLPAWVHGLLLGGLALFHTFYFLPLALATAVAVVLDRLAQRPPPLPLGRALVVAAVGLAASSPYWVPLALVRMHGAVADQQQRRWSPVGFTVPPLPWPVTGVGALGLLGVVWLVRHWRSSELGRGLGVALASSYVLVVGGQLAQRYGVALLVEKADQLVIALLVTSGVLGAARVVRLIARRGGRRRATAVAVLTTVVVGIPVFTDYQRQWLDGHAVVAAQHTRYPDGSFPAGGGTPRPTTTRVPWGVSAAADDPSTQSVEDRWRGVGGKPLGRTDVLLTTRVDLLATTPVHPFITWKNIYSNPYGRFQGRLDLVRRLQTCPSPRAAWRLLRHNSFDAVDGLVLNDQGGQLSLVLTTDHFPNGFVVRRLLLPARLFRRPWFRRGDVGGVAVIRVLPGAAEALNAPAVRSAAVQSRRGTVAGTTRSQSRAPGRSR
jgi:galactan 5-O-arabinofuranosyltransferase